MRRDQALEVTVSWGESPLELLTFDSPRDVWIGPDTDADVLCPEEVLPRRQLLARAVDGEWVIAVPEKVFIAGGLVVRVGIVERGPRAARKRLDTAALPFIAASALVHLAVLGGFMLLPPRAGALSLDRERDPNRIVDYMRVPLETDPAAIAAAETPAGDTEARTDPRTAEGGPGHAPGPDTHDRKNTGAKRPKRGGTRTAALDAIATVASALGNAAAGMAAGDTGAFGAATTKEGVERGILALLEGSIAGDGGALGPLGAGRGTCRMGAPCGGDIITLSKLVTKGGHVLDSSDGCTDALHCSGTGVGPGARRSKIPNKLTPHAPEVMGGLSKETIRIQMAHNRAKFIHCFEQGLRSMPDLAGRVAIRFTIRSDGAVMHAGIVSSALGHEGTERCLLEAVERITFPNAPGISIVTYPFVFERP